MAYLAKNINAFLVFLLILLLASLAGITLYYQSNYVELAKNYDTKIKEVNTLIDDLQLQKTKVNETVSELTLKQQREEKLSSQYVDVKSTNDQLIGNVSPLPKKLTETKNDLIGAQKNIVGLNQQIGTLQNDVSVLQSDVQKKVQSIKIIEARIDHALSTIEDLQGDNTTKT